ncbi:hypothetical protein P3S67_027119 [Capsicum chacoense]
MAFKFNFLLSATLSIVVIAFTFCHVFTSIKDVDDPKVVDIAKFAVNMENSQLMVKLEFQSTTYEMTIVASEFEESIELDVVVFENSKDNVKKVISIDDF